MSTDLLPRPLPGSPDRSTIAATLYRIDPSCTSITVSTRSLGVPVRGRLRHVAGCIDVHDDLTRSRVSVSAPLATFASRVPGADRWVHDAVLSTAEHPTVSFEADRLTPQITPVVAPDGFRPLWRLDGVVRLLGVRQPMVLHVGALQFADRRRVLHFTGTSVVSRRALGLTARRGVVADRLTLVIDGWADRAC